MKRKGFARRSEQRVQHRHSLPFWRLLAVWLLATAGPVLADDSEQQRARMVKEIEADVRDTRHYLGREALSERVRQVMNAVPRHRFVPLTYLPEAYANRPLPIGHGQTISQPYIVAIMTDLLEVEPEDAVFELGTGSGYQAAILAALGARVYTMEIVEPLGERARRTLAELGYQKVEVRVGDGYYGWPEHAPFDGIVVTAASDHIPPPLVQQLKPGGKMIIPIGSQFLTQQLMLVEKLEDGAVRTRELLPVRFVPLTGGH